MRLNSSKTMIYKVYVKTWQYLGGKSKQKNKGRSWGRMAVTY